jgi:hypothetical protein
MTATAAAEKLLTLGQAADRLRCQVWIVQRLLDRQLFTRFAYVGRNRVVAEDELDALKAALAAAGYLQAGE